MAEEPVMSLFDHVQVKEEFAAKLFDLVQGASDADEPGPMEVARLLFAEAGALMSACVGQEEACRWMIGVASNPLEDLPPASAESIN